MNENEERVLIKRTIIDIARKTSKSFKGIGIPATKMILEEAVQVLRQMILDGDYIVIAGLGVFFSNYLNANDIKDPRNNDIIHVPRRRIPKFFFSRNLKEKMREVDNHGAG